jgi:hypothetical protein
MLQIVDAIIAALPPITDEEIWETLKMLDQEPIKENSREVGVVLTPELQKLRAIVARYRKAAVNMKKMFEALRDALPAECDHVPDNVAKALVEARTASGVANFMTKFFFAAVREKLHLWGLDNLSIGPGCKVWTTDTYCDKCNSWMSAQKDSPLLSDGVGIISIDSAVLGSSFPFVFLRM